MKVVAMNVLEMTEMPAARPSILSRRFKAFVIPTSQKMVIKSLNA